MNVFDTTIFAFIHEPAGRWFLLDWLDILIAVYVPYVLVAGFVYLVLKEKNIKKRAYAFSWALLGMIISRGIITEVIRFFYDRPRPFDALGIDTVFAYAKEKAAFPSGHMAAYMTLVLPVWYLNKKWGAVYLGSVIVIGIARVYGAVHWPTDIIGGIVIAVAVSYGVKYALFKEDGGPEKRDEVEVIKENE